MRSRCSMGPDSSRPLNARRQKGMSEMSPPDEIPEASQLKLWLDWWFAPRWRALLTWVALAALTEWATYYHWKQVKSFYHRPIDLVNRFLPTPLPSLVDTIAFCV